MTQAQTLDQTRAIAVEEDFPHPPALLWQAISDGALMARWLMPPTGFAPVAGQNFTFTTTPAGAWDGVIRCQVLEVAPLHRLVFAWTGGDAGNQGYGSKLETTVTMTLTAIPTGTRLRVDHAGFVLPRNEVAYQNMSGGWTKVMGKLAGVLPDAAR